MVRALVILARGGEELEVVGSVNILRRAGVDVVLAGLDGIEPVKCSENVQVLPDLALSAVDKNSFDVIVLPGGLDGANNLGKSSLVGELLKNQEKNDKFIAAICLSPVRVLKPNGIGVNKRATGYPKYSHEMDGHFTFVDEAVVQDDKLITSQGPSTVYPWVLKIIENLVGVEKVKEVSEIGLFSKFYDK